MLGIGFAVGFFMIFIIFVIASKKLSGYRSQDQDKEPVNKYTKYGYYLLFNFVF